MTEDQAVQILSNEGAQCGNCGDQPGDRNCPDCEKCRRGYVAALIAAGWAHTDRFRTAWLSARNRANVLSAEVTRRAPLLGEYASEIERLRGELETARKVEASDTERLTHLEGENARLRSELTDAERRFLTVGPELTADDEAALERARRMADEAQQAGERAACGTPSPDGDYTCVLPAGHVDFHADKPLEAITPNGSRMIWETPIVARRNPDGGPLYCAKCGFGDDDLEPLTADDLPDGGICNDCGADVLIPQAGEQS